MTVICGCVPNLKPIVAHVILKMVGHRNNTSPNTPGGQPSAPEVFASAPSTDIPMFTDVHVEYSHAAGMDTRPETMTGSSATGLACPVHVIEASTPLQGKL